MRNLTKPLPAAHCSRGQHDTRVGYSPLLDSSGMMILDSPSRDRQHCQHLDLADQADQLPATQPTFSDIGHDPVRIPGFIAGAGDAQDVECVLR